MTITQQLDDLKIRIQKPEFLNVEGLGNEVGIWFFCYEPKQEMMVRDFTQKLVYSSNLDCRLIERNLYSVFLEICDEWGITQDIGEMEKEDGKELLLEKITSSIGVDEFVNKIYFSPQTCGKDVLLLTGVGDVFPFMRVHTLLQALQPKFPNIPILVMYPGTFNGTQTRLFNKYKPNPWYRSYNII